MSPGCEQRQRTGFCSIHKSARDFLSKRTSLSSWFLAGLFPATFGYPTPNGSCFRIAAVSDVCGQFPLRPCFRRLREHHQGFQSSKSSTSQTPRNPLPNSTHRIERSQQYEIIHTFFRAGIGTSILPQISSISEKKSPNEKGRVWDHEGL